MEGTVLGNKDTKELVIAIVAVGNATGKSFSDDGKMGVNDLPNYFSVLGTLGPALAGVENVPAELADFDEAEQADLIQTVQTKFDIPQDDVEDLIEDALMVGIHLHRVVKKFKALAEKKATATA